MGLMDTLRDLAEYTRSLEEELDGPDSGEGEALVAANALLSGEDIESIEWGTCPDNLDGGSHEASKSLCVWCLEYDPR